MREELSNLEHEQWMSWSQSLDKQLFKPRGNLPIAYPEDIGKNFIEKKDKWLKLWKPYSDLDEKTKDSDRIWADKILVLIGEKVKKLEEGTHRKSEMKNNVAGQRGYWKAMYLMRELIEKLFVKQDDGVKNEN